MQKYTTKQKKAIEDLLLNLDELENKPRILFYALEELAIAFNEIDAIPSIREAQDLIYSHINEGEHYAELFTSLREFKIEEWRYQIKNPTRDLGEVETDICAVERFIQKHISRLAEKRFF